MTDHPCLFCGTPGLAEFEGFGRLDRVTSDALPFRPGGRLAVCRRCGGVQKIPDARWQAETAEIYGNYAVYRPAGGIEQAVFDPRDGKPRRRSEVIFGHLRSRLALPATGRLLDVGCGAGGMLKAASAAMAGGWALYGAELDERNLPALSAIPGFTTLFVGDIAAIAESFDVITLVHALEHFADPVSLLASLKPKIRPGGHLVIQVPNAEANPFDLVIADHIGHYTPASLRRVLARAGFEAVEVATDCVAKELTAIAIPAQGAVAAPPAETDAEARFGRILAWMGAFADTAAQAAAGASAFGLFGTSIVATWLHGRVGDRVAFFVDEDQFRIGNTHMDKPILAPSSVPAGAIVYLALVPAVAARVKARLDQAGVRAVEPPAFPE